MQFLNDAVAYYARLGVGIKRLLTDNGAAFRSHDFARACQALGIQHRFTRAYRPQTNGKAERFIQSALREWAYGWTYQNSTHRLSPPSWHARRQACRGGTQPPSAAEKRAIETIQDGKPSTDFMKIGDTIRVEVKGKDGQSLFGAIDQKLAALGD